jgi:Protein of unknown function (DUF1439)
MAVDATAVPASEQAPHDEPFLEHRLTILNAVPLRLLAALILVCATSWLAGCAQLAGPRVMTLSEADFARMIGKQFPFDRRLLEVLDVRVAAPQLTLLPATNRIGTALEVQTSDRLFGKTYRGRIDMDYALRYDDAEQAIRLTQVRVGRLEVEGLPVQLQAAFDRLGPILAEQVLKDLPIYRFKPEDLRGAQGLGYKPGAVTVTARGVEITLVPAR